MGHLLASVNPEAADAIDHPPAPPDVGTWVVYRGRAGFSRMHRTEFAALVLGAHDDGSLTLMVVMEPEDMMMEIRVPFQSHNQPNFCWRYRVKSKEEMAAENSEFAALDQRVAALEAAIDGEDILVDKVEALEKQVWGDYNATDKSIFSHLAGFEDRLKEAGFGKKAGRPPKAKKEK